MISSMACRHRQVLSYASPALLVLLVLARAAAPVASAVAFGIDRSFLRKLESIGTPPPTWYPSASGWGYPGGVVVLPCGFNPPGRTSSGPATTAPPDAGGIGGPPSSGPQSWSDGLADLLNAASDALAAGGGSGGWSGGGFGGGGGGGGGSGGFQ